MARFGSLGQQYFDSNGDPLSAGLIYFYEPGTTTDKTVYSDDSLTTPHAQPVVLTAGGRQPDIFFDGEAKAVLQDSSGGHVDTTDPIGEPAEDSGIGDWSSAATYDISDLVKGSDDNYYLSVQNANTGNDPTGPSPSWWMEAEFISVYNANFAYSIGNVATHDGKLWRSLQSPNTGNTPSESSAYWRRLSAPLVLAGTVRTSAFVASAGVIEPIDSTGGAFTITLPSSPSDGDSVGFRDEGGALSTNRVTLDRSGNSIIGVAANHDLDINRITYILTFRDGDWRY